MRHQHLEYLTDPATGQPLTLTIYDQQGPHIISGLLASPSHRYPIIDGIPRLTPQSQLKKDAAFNTHQKKTADSFSYEWNNIYQENEFEKQNFLHFLGPFIKACNLKDKKILDAGCGSGRFAKQAALCGAEVVIATDVGESPRAAYKLTQHLSNVCIIQADLYHMPVVNFADLTFSIGVLHHLPEPQKGFTKLTVTVKPGGQYLIWVYNRRNNFRAVYVFESIRKITRHIPKSILYKLCYLPGAAVHSINYVTHFFNKVGASRLAKKIPFSYYANFPYRMKLNDAFDVLATPKSNYYYTEEIENWFKEARLQNVQTYEHPEAGITAVGSLEQTSDKFEHVSQLHHVSVANNLRS
ncbi:MAG: methyltransferase domain-containing protein [bacterium]